MKSTLWFCAAMVCFAFVSHSYSQVLEGPRGPVEFVGLKNWEASELYDAIQELDPDKPFHACAATMKSELEFADAAAFGFMKSFEDPSMYTVVVGIEDSSDVQYRTPGEETLDLPIHWLKLQAVAEDDFSTLASLVQARFQAIEANKPEQAPAVAEYFGANPDTVHEVWNLVDLEYDASDRSLALEVLAKDASRSARTIAAMILGYFSDNDKSWHGLAAALLDSDARVRDVAGKVLTGLVRSDMATQVAWSGAREELAALFGGTNPWAFNPILESLVATEIDTEFALELAQEKPDLLLAYAGTGHERFNKPALDFLKAISGRNFEGNVEAWSSWLNEPDLVN